MIAGALLRSGQYDAAIAEYNELVRCGPRWWVAAYHNRGIAWKNKGAVHQAIDDFSQAIRLDPKCPDSYASRSSCWISAKRPDLAFADASAAIRLAPGDFLSYQKRAAALSGLGRYECAMADYDRAIQLGINIPSSYQYRAWFLATCPDPRIRDGQRALADAYTAYQLCLPEARVLLDPDGCHGVAAMETLAAAHAECGDFAEAARWQQQAMNTLPAGQPDHHRAEKRLKLYQQHKRYIEQPVIPLPAR